MPLDPRKIQHIQNVTNASFANRQRTVVLVTLSGSVYSYSTLLAIMRPLQILNPQVLDVSADVPLRNPDMLMQAPGWHKLHRRRLYRGYTHANVHSSGCGG